MSNQANPWAAAAQSSSSGGGGSNWIKLKADGDTVTFIPRGAPKEFVKNMPASQYGEAGPKRFGALNCYVIETKEMKIWESGVRAYGNICEAIAEGGINAVYKIKRKGAAGSNTTQYLCMRLRDATQDELAAADAAGLHKLGPKDELPF